MYIVNFNNINDYLPLLNACIITDLFIIFLSNIRFIKSKTLQEWYSKYKFSAVIADVLIILINVLVV